MVKEKATNREVKDSVFTDLFYSDESADANERALYEALHKEPLPKGITIRKMRIEKQIYMKFQNVISFQTGDKVLVFGEHQSTFNENMPLRDLLYAGRALEMLVSPKDRFKRKRITIPKPEFYCFYNGKEKREKESFLNLSDLYETTEGEEFLELKVKVININLSEGHEILERCPILKEYQQFIETIRKYKEENDEEPYKHAILECIDKGILSDYLQRKGSEVVNMLMSEYDYDTDIAVQREEAEQIGEACGEMKKAKETAKELYAMGMNEEDIAKATKVSVEQIQQWLTEK